MQERYSEKREISNLQLPKMRIEIKRSGGSKCNKYAAIRAMGFLLTMQISELAALLGQ